MNPPNMKQQKQFKRVRHEIADDRNFLLRDFPKINTRKFFLAKRFFTFDQIKSSAPHVVRVYRAANVKEN